jgi:hypothetical protein
MRLLLFSQNKESRPVKKKGKLNKQNAERQSVIQVPELSGQSGKKRFNKTLYMDVYNGMLNNGNGEEEEGEHLSF